MRNRRLETVFLAAVLLAGAAESRAATPEYHVVDAVGADVHFVRTPKRIVPLQPSLAELAVRVGAPIEAIVGVSAYTDFPLELKKKPSIGSYAKPNLEAILALKPELVLAGRDGTPKEIVARLGKLGIPVVTVATETLAGLREAYRVVGAALRRSTEATAALAEFDGELAALRKRAETRTKAGNSAKVLLQVGEDPLVVAAGKTYLNEGLGVIGATNVYADPEQTYPRVSIEDVLKKDPDAIVLVGMGDDVAQFSRAEKRWKSYPKLAAARAGRIVLLRSDSLVRPGPRFPGGLVELERAVYGAKAAEGGKP
ncbi:MAG: ABC transporter substrate-binding protein [Bdellovibrionales bacterium]|nr:ABC transporter substrate-binding protein [Bdellovibrionales bacterium]